MKCETLNIIDFQMFISGTQQVLVTVTSTIQLYNLQCNVS